MSADHPKSCQQYFLSLVSQGTHNRPPQLNNLELSRVKTLSFTEEYLFQGIFSPPKVRVSAVQILFGRHCQQLMVFLSRMTARKECLDQPVSSELHFEVIGEGIPHVLLDVIDLLICEAAVHGAVGDAVAVRGALLLGVCEAVYEHHRLHQVAGVAANHLAQVVLCEAHLRQPEAHVLRNVVCPVVGFLGLH